MKEFTINLGDDELDALMMEEKSVKEVLKDHFERVNSAWLGEKNIQDFDIGEVNFNIVDLKGDFELIYTVPYLSGYDEDGESINKARQKKVTYSFIVDIESKQIVCHIGK